jgi:hypothetical protein
MAYAKDELREKWKEYCSQACKGIEWFDLSGRPVDLTEEQAGESQFSYRRGQERWGWLEDRALPKYNMFRLGKAEGLKNEILECAIKSGRIEGHTCSSPGQRITPGPGMITLEALKKAVEDDSDEIILRGEDKLFCAWLAIAEVTAPQDVAPAMVPQETQPAPDLFHGKTTPAGPWKSNVDPVIHEELLAEFGRIWTAKEPNPISAREMGKKIGPRLRARGYPKVRNNRVEALALSEQYRILVRHKTRKSKITEAEIAAAREQLAKLRSGTVVSS